MNDDDCENEEFGVNGGIDSDENSPNVSISTAVSGMKLNNSTDKDAAEISNNDNIENEDPDTEALPMDCSDNDLPPTPERINSIEKTPEKSQLSETHEKRGRDRSNSRNSDKKSDKRDDSREKYRKNDDFRENPVETSRDYKKHDYKKQDSKHQDSKSNESSHRDSKPRDPSPVNAVEPTLKQSKYPTTHLLISYLSLNYSKDDIKQMISEVIPKSRIKLRVWENTSSTWQYAMISVMCVSDAVELQYNLDKKNYGNIFGARRKVCYDDLGLKLKFYEINDGGGLREGPEKYFKRMFVVKRSGGSEKGAYTNPECMLTKCNERNFKHIKMAEMEKQGNIKNQGSMMDMLSGKNRKRKTSDKNYEKTKFELEKARFEEEKRAFERQKEEDAEAARRSFLPPPNMPIPIGFGPSGLPPPLSLNTRVTPVFLKQGPPMVAPNSTFNPSVHQFIPGSQPGPTGHVFQTNRYNSNIGPNSGPNFMSGSSPVNQPISNQQTSFRIGQPPLQYQKSTTQPEPPKDADVYSPTDMDIDSNSEKSFGSNDMPPTPPGSPPPWKKSSGNAQPLGPVNPQVQNDQVSKKFNDFRPDSFKPVNFTPANFNPKAISLSNRSRKNSANRPPPMPPIRPIATPLRPPMPPMSSLAPKAPMQRMPLNQPNFGCPRPIFSGQPRPNVPSQIRAQMPPSNFSDFGSQQPPPRRMITPQLQHRPPMVANSQVPPIRSQFSFSDFGSQSSPRPSQPVMTRPPGQPFMSTTQNINNWNKFDDRGHPPPPKNIVTTSKSQNYSTWGNLKK